MLIPKKPRDFEPVVVQLRSDAAMVLRSAAAEKRLTLEVYLSDFLLEAAKKQAFENLKSPVIR